MFRAALNKYDAAVTKDMFNTALLGSETTLREMEANRIRLNQARSSSDFKQIHAYRSEFRKQRPVEWCNSGGAAPA